MQQIARQRKEKRRLPKKKKKRIPFRVLVCGTRGNAISLTVPQSGDPTMVIYEKVARIFEKMVEQETETDNMKSMEEMDGFLRFIEATDFKPVSQDETDWN
ncbi:hypothetical protein A3I18_00865 [Candidatus Campbellbacteria bacterium RIFCSPLOWO2_02_FULL_35_11]|uniref:Uncharacterized protein n=2 Tax=Candidatus Campbelliibacteriota TaxID=1752727 RepID=A0A1F5EQZ5_9BACT|nr:MAG: hypothetical protein A3I18_00865 [Candidatus Campbellbacteria bacterium RIFCSPLOWO2_02_FULL_35_11]OGD69666.1 MAG: hypothetical protein A3E89_01310 [Candidatus Campbellbacteria bacterium RIFCSPHIGHO2_12_FULL_35_10]